MYLTAILPFLTLPASQVPVTFFMHYEQKCVHLGPTFTCEKLDRVDRLTLGSDGSWSIEENGRTTRLRTAKDDQFILVLERPVAEHGTSTINILTPINRFYNLEVTWSDKKKDDNVVMLGGKLQSWK